MKWLFGTLGVLIIMAIGLSFYLQPNSLALCPGIGQPTTRLGCEAAQAIVAISGGDTAARTRHAVDLYKHGWAPLIIFSGAAADKEGLSNAAAMRLDAINQGVSAKDILIEEYSDNTRQNAQKTRDVLQSRNINDIILVTSGYHMRRAALEFNASVKDQGITVRTSPTNDKHWSGWWFVTPQGWGLALGEFGRIIAFYVGGGGS